MKTLYFTAIIASLLFCLTSCVKEKDFVLPADPVTTTKTDTSFSTLKVAENFDWSTSKQISFRFAGSGQANHQLILKVALPDSSVLFQKLQKANEDFQGVLDIPAHVGSVMVSYGSITKVFECSTGTITMTNN